MKSVLAFSLLFTMHAQAAPDCAQEAVTVAKTSSRGSTLVGLQRFDAGRDYLVGYEVAIENQSNGRVDAFRIILMSSDCSVVSVKPAL